MVFGILTVQLGEARLQPCADGRLPGSFPYIKLFAEAVLSSSYVILAEVLPANAVCSCLYCFGISGCSVDKVVITIAATTCLLVTSCIITNAWRCVYYY